VRLLPAQRLTVHCYSACGSSAEYRHEHVCLSPRPLAYDNNSLSKLEFLRMTAVFPPSEICCRRRLSVAYCTRLYYTGPNYHSYNIVFMTEHRTHSVVNNSKWSNKFHTGQYSRRARIVRSYSQGNANVHPYPIHRSLDPYQSAPNGFSIGSAVFARLTGVTNTYRHTGLRGTCDVSSNRPHRRSLMLIFRTHRCDACDAT